MEDDHKWLLYVVVKLKRYYQLGVSECSVRQADCKLQIIKKKTKLVLVVLSSLQFINSFKVNDLLVYTLDVFRGYRNGTSARKGSY